MPTRSSSCILGKSGADDLHDDAAMPWPRVEVDENDLLPRSQRHGPVDHRHGEARTEQRRANVRVAVVIVPRPFVKIVAVFGRDSLERGRQIPRDQPGLVLRRGDAGRRPDHEHGGCSTLDRTFAEAVANLIRNVDYVRVATGIDLKLVSFDGHSKQSSHRARPVHRDRSGGPLIRWIRLGGRTRYNAVMSRLEYRTAGESHGAGLIALVEGFPAGVRVDTALINAELARRQGGYGRGGRMKIERDEVAVLSGLRGGATIGSPILLHLVNRDHRIDKAPAVTRPRPGHADLAGSLKWLTTDCRNTLERASARETAARVAAGALTRSLLREFDIEVIGFVVRIGGVAADFDQEAPASQLRAARDANEAYCPDPVAAERMISAIKQAKVDKDTLGGVVEVRVTGHPPGLGSCMRWQDKLDGRLMQAVGSIQAFKAVEIGAGFAVAERPGSAVHDAINYDPAQRDQVNLGFVRPTNHAGGLEGGMTNGAPIVVRGAMKPISTLLQGMDSVNLATKKRERSDYERSDIAAVPAASVVAENVVAFEIARAFLEKFAGDTLGEVRAAHDHFLTSARWLGSDA